LSNFRERLSAGHGFPAVGWRYSAMAHITLVVVPYDAGHRDVRMGRGPGRLLDRGLVAALEADGHGVSVTTVESRLEPPTEILATFELARGIAVAVRDARAAGRHPIVLAGNCFSAIGTLAGLDGSATGVLWLDAHGDLNTPETTRSGLLDGMALAAVTGRCWRELATTVPGFAPVPDPRVVLFGARALDTPEETLVAALGLRCIAGHQLEGPENDARLRAFLDRMTATVDHFYLHVDLDVLDPGVAVGNAFAAPGGLALETVRAIIESAAEVGGIAAAAIASYDPAHDPQDHAADAAVRIVRWIAGAVHRAGTRAAAEAG
jgi:arginase